MASRQKEIWNYQNSIASHTIKIYEKDRGILIIVSQGTALREGCERAFDFIITYTQMENKKVNCLLDNTEFKSIDPGVRTLFLRFGESNQYINKVATIGNNYLLKNLGVECGFIKIEKYLDKCKNQILNILKANEAKGFRKYIRVICNFKLDTFNIIMNDRRYEGNILDLSIAGMACTFRDDYLKLTEKIPLKNIQLVLHGAVCFVSGIVAGIRNWKQGKKLYIIMFNMQEMKVAVQEKIHNFIYQHLQDSIEKELAEIKT